jgi:hypothetical protein
MLGFIKKRGQVKSVEDFVNGRETGPVSADDAAWGTLDAFKAKARVLVPAAIALGLFLLSLAGLNRISHLEAGLAQLRHQNDNGTIEGLKTQRADLVARLDRSGKETEQLRADIVRLEKDVETMRAISLQKAKKEAAASKKPVAAKKPVPKPRAKPHQKRRA